jgi:glucosamine--fructose-6-phosphate aminotransferase (isomerizing)
MAKMGEETRQQPEALARTLEEADGLARCLERRRPRLVILAARGTSDNAAQFGRYLIEITTGIPVSLAAPSVVTLYHSQIDFREVLVVGVSQSGESTDINMFLEDARSRGAFTVGVTNEPASTLAELSEYVVLARAGREQSVAATKTYTCQLMAMYLLACALGGRCRLDALRRIPDCVAGALELENSVAAAAGEFAGISRALCVGRGLNFANALEFGLKLMETCYVVAERFSAADLMHGPIAMVEKGFPVFAFAPAGVTWPSISGVIRRLRELHAQTLIVTDWPVAAEEGQTLLLPQAPEAPAGLEDLYTPIPYIVPAQLFAAHLAAIKGIDPDQPRTLQKVTRTL